MTNWEDSIGGQVGEKFRRALKDPTGLELAKFTLEHPFETHALLSSYEESFQKPFEKLLDAIYNQPLLKNPVIESSPPKKKTHKKTFNRGYAIAAYFLVLTAIPISCFVIKNTLYKAQGIQTEKPQVAGVSTTNLAVLDNPQEGYRFSYPKSFSVLNDNEGLKLSSLKTGEEIIVSVNSQIVDVKPAKDPVSSQTKEAIGIIQNTFKFTKPFTYNDQELQNRFSSASDLPVN